MIERGNVLMGIFRKGPRLYSYGAVARFIDDCIEAGYDYVEVSEGVLGAGHVLMIAPDGVSGYEIRERALNEWSSAHTVRRFSRLSRRLENLIAAAA